MMLQEVCSIYYEVKNTQFICSYLTVSNQLVAEDVHNLRMGLDAVKKEKELEPDNFILFISYSILNN